MSLTPTPIKFLKGNKDTYDWNKVTVHSNEEKDKAAGMEAI